MHATRRIDEIVDLLTAYALGEIDLPEGRVTAALRLLDWAIDDAPLPDGGEELPALANGQAVLAFAPRIVG